MPVYEVWVHHGEDPPPRIVLEVQSHKEEDYDRMEEMLDDVRHELLTVDSENPGQPTEFEDLATPEVQKFFRQTICFPYQTYLLARWPHRCFSAL